jgi:hypothetical protein
MSIAKIVVLTCDGLDFGKPDPRRASRCAATFAGERSEPRDVVIHRAKIAGWSVTDGGAWHYCPTCTERAAAASKRLRERGRD